MDSENPDPSDAPRSAPEDHARARALEHRAEGTMRRQVHDLVPLAIVIVSVLAAIMGWRASVSDEAAAHAEELSRQDLVHQQQLDLRDVQEVDGQVRSFGLYAEDSLLSHALARDARKLKGGVAEQLSGEAQADVGLARALGRELGYTYPAAAPFVRPDGTYNAARGSAIRPDRLLAAVENRDPELHGLDPERLTSEAESNRSRGLHLEGIAALFVAALVFFTLAAVRRNERSRWFAGSGVIVAVAALVLFAIVEVS